jgi:hypothetical protein
MSTMPPLHTPDPECVHGFSVIRAGSCLSARQGRTRKCMSIHDRVMTPTRGQTNPARRVELQWPPGSGPRLDLTPGQALRRAPLPGGHCNSTRMTEKP